MTYEATVAITSKCTETMYVYMQLEKKKKYVKVYIVITNTDNMSRVVRKLAFCICENKDADQLRGNHEADQLLFSLH